MTTKPGGNDDFTGSGGLRWSGLRWFITVGVAVAVPLATFVVGREIKFAQLLVSQSVQDTTIERHQSTLERLENIMATVATNQQVVISTQKMMSEEIRLSREWREAFTTEVRSRLVRIETKLEDKPPTRPAER